MASITTEQRNALCAILQSHGVRKAGIFGSRARGDIHAASDLDVLVELSGDASLFDMIRLKHELEDSLNLAIDLVEYNALKPLIRDSVLREEIRLI